MYFENTNSLYMSSRIFFSFSNFARQLKNLFITRGTQSYGDTKRASSAQSKFVGKLCTTAMQPVICCRHSAQYVRNEKKNTALIDKFIYSKACFGPIYSRYSYLNSFAFEAIVRFLTSMQCFFLFPIHQIVIAGSTKKSY